jgi:hypothetical protein
MRILPLIVIFYALLFLGACKSSQPNRPVENYEKEQRFEQQSSIIRIPVDIDLEDLELSLNKYFAESIYEDNSFEDGDKMKVKAKKEGDIKLHVRGTSVSYQIPLSLWLQYDLGLGKVEATGRLDLDFKTDFKIESDWQLTTKTALQTHEWKEKPRLRMGAVSIPVQSIANLIIQRSETTIANNIDEAVAANFKMEEYVAEAWKLMFAPYQVSEDYQTWLMVNPTDLGMTPLQVIDGRMQATIVVQSQPSLRFGDEPRAPQRVALPPFNYRYLNQEAERGFQIFLDATLPYEDAEKLTRQSLQGERFEQGKRYVIVEDIELYGQGNNLVVNLQLSGSYNGSIYLAGQPVFNARRNRIEIDDLEYTLDTKNFLLRSAAWLAKGTLKTKLQENMDYLLDYNLRDAQEQMQSQLNGYEIGPGVTLKGKLEELNLHNAYLTTTGIKVVMAFYGELGIEVAGLSDL